MVILVLCLLPYYVGLCDCDCVLFHYLILHVHKEVSMKHREEKIKKLEIGEDLIIDMIWRKNCLRLL